MTMKESPSQTLRERVLSCIDNERVCPRDRFFFLCYDSIVWLLWGMSVVVGALAVAVALFVVTESRTRLFLVTHDSFWSFFLDVAPYVWIVVFGVMSLFAIVNLRHTKRGYRYTVVQLLASSVILSLAGGAVLQLVGFGHGLDTALGKRVPMYVSQDKFEKRLWLMPDEGRLIGRQVMATLAPTSTVIFEDISGARWTVTVTDLSPYDIALLASEATVRMVGTSSDSIGRRFHACGTLPDGVGETSVESLLREHQAFVERMYTHVPKEQPTPDRALYETDGTDMLPNDERVVRETPSPCATVPMLRRIEDGNRRR